MWRPLLRRSAENQTANQREMIKNAVWAIRRISLCVVNSPSYALLMTCLLLYDSIEWLKLKLKFNAMDRIFSTNWNFTIEEMIYLNACKMEFHGALLVLHRIDSVLKHNDLQKAGKSMLASNRSGNVWTDFGYCFNNSNAAFGSPDRSI